MRYRLVAETSFDAPTNAEAKDWFADKIDADALPYGLTISAEEENAKPHLGEDHPANVATHAVLEALRLMASLRATESRAMGVTLSDAIVDRLSDVPRLIAEVFLQSIRNERCMAELRAENVVLKRENVAIHAKNTNLASRHNQARAALQHVTELLAPHPVTFAPRGVLEIAK